MQALMYVNHALQEQRGHLMPWLPVFFGFGIGWFFLLGNDPSFLMTLFVALAAVLALSQIRHRDARSFVAWIIVFVGVGFLNASLRTNWVEAPVLKFRYYGPVEGRLIQTDRSANGSARLLLDRVRLSGVALDKTPQRVRISLSSGQVQPMVGVTLATTAHLMPPQGPSEPGGFDFRRYAWFMKLGANGYSRNPVVVLQPAETGLYLQRFRDHLSQFVQDQLGPETGGVAAAIIAGDRSGVSAVELSNLRTSNLAHLLAISGLHMGLLSGFIFAGLRFVLCLVPAIALRLNVKKVSACAALLMAMMYLGISGGNVSTERAFLMVLVMFVAILLDRRALSLRAVAVAATLVLLRRPETMLSPGFQMSFAATTALVAVFGWTRSGHLGLGPAWLRPFATVLLSSAVAGAATAPFGSAHFNVMSHYGLLANVLAVPIMGLVVVPSAVLALSLMPLGLEQFGFQILDLGLKWILGVAAWVSSLPNAQSGVVSPNVWVLPLLSIGALFAVLWKGHLRWVGIPVILISLFLWSAENRPVLLVSKDGGLLGVMTQEGRALSREKGRGYTAMAWLSADGDLTTQYRAAARWPKGTGSQHNLTRIAISGRRVTHIVGQRQALLKRSCAASEIVIANIPLKLEGECLTLDLEYLRGTGSIRMDADGTITTAADFAGDRPWSRQ